MPRFTLIWLLALTGCGASTPPKAAPRTLFGGDRPAVLQVPVAYDGTTPMPLLVILHGYSSSGAGHVAYFGADSLANTAGVLVLAPDGLRDERGNRFWNATDACCDLAGNGVDDVAYLKGLIADVRHDYRVDPRRIYLLGHSNGGFMAHRMACEDADEIAAIVSLAGALWNDPARCSPAGGVSVLDIHGDADSTIAFDGGDIDGHAYPGEAATIGKWAGEDGCTGGPVKDSESVDLVAALPDAETSVSRWTGCREGLGVELWTIRGEGHVPKFKSDFALRMWNWLAAHPRN